MEETTGKSYAALLAETILAKLDLHDTYFLSYPDNIAVANGYDEALLHLGRRNLTGFRRSLESDAYSADGILSTYQEMARFVNALFVGDLISNTSLAEMKLSWMPGTMISRNKRVMDWAFGNW